MKLLTKKKNEGVNRWPAWTLLDESCMTDSLLELEGKLTGISVQKLNLLRSPNSLVIKWLL